MRRLPAGTVTFLFTDVEGSTKLLHELGSETYADALGEHRRALREAFGRHGGVEVDTQGDAFFVAFPTAPGALAAARTATGLLAPGPIRIRIGIHTGTPLVTEDGYVGADVHRAARIAACGHGGQVLVSSSTASLVEGDGLRDLGEHRLKDLAAPERLFQLGDGDFPALRSLYRTNLPVVTGALVGRERELGEAAEMLKAHRLVTFTGPGGSGKTRLALHLAADAADGFPDGVFWVPLQAVRDPAIVEHTIAAAVGADADLISHIGSKRMLILLDNFEQVIEAAAIVSALCTATPYVKVLVTSREPLHVGGEQCYPVEPLRLDEAELLFDVRARAVLPTFRPTPEVRLICERLDSLPLAVELAAARVPLLDPAALLARLEQRLPLLASRSRDAPERQRTLSAAIAWSYELLDEDEQQLFRRLSVFRGSFSLEAAESVCDADVHAIESLVVKNLARRRWETGRLLMLDTIREYAWERLHESSEAEALHRRHAEFFSAVARSANLSAGSLAPGGQRLELAFAEQDNFRSALDWAQRTGEIEAGVVLATALEQFWVANDPGEGVRRFRALFEHPAARAVAPEVRAHGLRAWGSSTHIAGDPAAAERLWEESLALFEQLGDEHGCAVLLHRLSITALIGGDLARARELVESSHAIHERNDDWWQRTWAHAQTTGTRGAIARESGDDTRAQELLAESAELAREARVAWWQGGMLRELSALRLRQGQISAAEDDARESLEIAERLGDRSGKVFAVGLLAGVAAERGQLERAGRLLGAIERERALAPLGGWQRHADDVWTRVRELADGTFETALAAGRELELDDAVAYGREAG